MNKKHSTAVRSAKRFGFLLPGVAALAGCVDIESSPQLGTTNAAVSSVWECTTTCSCRYSFGVKMENAEFYSGTSTVSSSLAQAECANTCYEDDYGHYESAIAGPTSCSQPSDSGSGSGSGPTP